MSNLGPVYEDDEDYSPARMNAKGIIRDTGTNIMALAITKQIGLAMPTDTSGGLVKNVLYYADYDTSFNRLTFEPVFHRHTHDINLDSNEDGGSYLESRLANIAEFVEVNLSYLHATPSAIWQTVATNGTLTFVNSGSDTWHRLDTGSTALNHITAKLHGVSYQWDFKLNIQVQLGLTENANILVRAGIGIDSINDAPSTSRRQMAMEGCDGHGTNWVLLNANGNSASLVVTATTMPLLDTKDTYLMEHIPADTVNVYKNGVLNASSTTNVADDGSTDMDKLFRWGVKLPTGSDNIEFDLFYLKIIGNHQANT